MNDRPSRRAGRRRPGVPVSDEGERLAHCQHPQSEVSWRISADGRRYYVRQCSHCHASVGNLIASAVALADGRKPLPFDEAAQAWSREAVDRFYTKQSAILAEQRNERSRAFWNWYDAYLQSDAWREKRAQALKRDNGLCQGCLKRPATQVHHLTYAHVGDELLFELAPICDECHERAHRGRTAS
jgi:5-methylcytosine-specific restriction endonuclease McrA